MKSHLSLAFVLVLYLAPPLAAQTTAATKVVPIGQLNGAVLRQMAAAFCGPYFTMLHTDANGGGWLNLVVDRTPDDMAVVTFPVKAIQVKFCDSCEAPLFKQSGDESSVRGDLTISREQWKLSPCLKSAKLSKQ